jgi:hypothetical protein
MARREKPRDSRLEVARYQVDKLTPDEEKDEDTAGQFTMDQRAAFVEIQIQQAMRRGDFDDLPGAGKPLTGLTETYDPNWWIRQKIEREQLTGLGPPALTLRSENAALDDRILTAPSEHSLRELLEDFNTRVVDARRQLLGGPPVVTPTRDIEREVERWREHRAERLRALREQQEREAAELAAMSWRERRRARRAR